MQITLEKIASLFVVIVYAVAMTMFGGGLTGRVFGICIASLLPLALIWFPYEFSRLTGDIRGAYIHKQMLPVLISMLGWGFLVGLLVLFYFLR
jgi:hypothetical protein